MRLRKALGATSSNAGFLRHLRVFLSLQSNRGVVPFAPDGDIVGVPFNQFYVPPWVQERRSYGICGSVPSRSLCPETNFFMCAEQHARLLLTPYSGVGVLQRVVWGALGGY